MEDNSCKFGANVRSVRRAKDMTQSDLAKLSSLTVNAIHLIERDKQMPSVATASKIAKALGTTIDELLK